MHNKLIAMLAAAAAFASAPAAAADVGAGFSRGSTQVGVTGGTGYAFNQSYFVLGVGVGYYVFDGLSVGLSLESWTGEDPKMLKVTPSVQYVFRNVPYVKPYLGVFYRRAYVDGLPDINSVGGRAGGYFPVGRNAYFGAGAVYESYLDCSTAIYTSCTSTYAELTVMFAF